MYPKLLELRSIPIVGQITLYTYGVLLAAAYLLGLKLAIVRANHRGLDSNRVLDLGIYIIISALIGAKLLLLVTDFNTFHADPRELFTLLRSGGVFYGGLIVAVAVALVYIRRVGLPLWTTCDVFAPGIALGHAIGRFGCLFAGCCYGRETSVPWAITFKDPFAGRTFWLYMLLYAVSRFIIEFYRGDERGMVFMFSTSQFISLLLAPLALVMLVYLSRAEAPEPKRARKAA